MGSGGLFSARDDKRAYQAEWHLGKLLSVSGQHAPAADPTTAAAAVRHALPRGARLLFGTVVDGCAYVHGYRVFFEGGHPPIVCTPLAATSLAPLGARQAHTLLPGTPVWCLVHPELSHGVILGAEPLPSTDPTQALSDRIHGASRSGLRVDAHHHALFRLPGAAGLVDWSAGRPLDGTLAGEWGVQTETGLRVFVDSFLAQLGASEACGVFAFYHDELLRVAGVNLQELTAGSERELLLDQGEIAGYRGITPYPWEQLGATRPGLTPLRTVDARAEQVDTPWYGPLEPQSDDQAPFHRVVDLEGYLGQGGRRMVLLPPAAGGLLRADGGGAAAPTLPCVFAQQTSLAGRHVIESALGTWLIKRVAIPGPRRVRRPESATGDDERNYRFAGLDGQGGGTPHQVAGTLAPSAAGPLAGVQQAAAAADTIAYLCNWEGVHPLHYHARDWQVPEESALAAGPTQVPVRFADLAAQPLLAAPPPVAQHVDHRYGDVPYTPNLSYFGQLDDGGIVLGDGFGSEIRMTGGSIWISCPGDLWLKPGKNGNLWAGRDAIVRARHAFDLSAGDGDGRIKADRNLQMLARTGGLLLESRGTAAFDYADKVGEDVTAGGIQLKSSAGPIAAWAAGLYLRTGGGDVADGPITLDAGRGTQPVQLYASDAVRYLGGAAVDYFGTEGSVTAVSRSGPEGTRLAGPLTVAEGLTVTGGGLTVRGDVVVAGGHVATSEAARRDGRVDPLAGKDLDDVQDRLQAEAKAARQAVQAGGRAWQAAFAEDLYAPGQPGAADTIAAVAFSFRTAAQYKTTDLPVFEDRWQQLARLSGGAPAVWTETGVQAGATLTMPHPGRETWKDQAALLEQDLTLVDVAAGTARDRTADRYGAPRLAGPRAVVADGRYAVIL